MWIGVVAGEWLKSGEDGILIRDNAAMPGGRPTKYQPIFARQAGKCAQHGLTQAEIADFLEVDVSTVERWMIAYPEFCGAIKENGSIADDRVERSLYETALGGNVTAQIFWLKNRRRRDWC